MSYTFRWILYLINKLMTVLSLVWAIYSLIKLVTNLDEWLKWLLWTAAGMVSYVLSKVLFVMRKSTFPLAGKDYI